MELRDPGEEDPDLDPGEGPTADLDGIGQGHPGEADMTVDLVLAGSRTGADPNILATVRTAAAATTTAGRTTRTTSELKIVQDKKNSVTQVN